MTKNFYKNLIKILERKEIIVFVAILVLILLAFPSPALAFWEKIVAALTAIPVLLIAILMLFLILLTGFFVWIVSAILEWIISPDFVSLSYTKPCPGPTYQPTTDPTCNPIIGIGLDVTLHLVNLLLVAMLVYIALAIALRIGEHDAKKLFPKLIIVALLVNFAPVLVGLIVDAANILMNYFLSPLQGGISQVGNQLSVFWDSIVKSLGKVWSDLPAQLGLLGLGQTMIILNLFLVFVLGIFAGLFLVRYIAIWVLVILAPIAFAFWILPGTKKYWDMWWNQLIQWSFIGIPVAFFLYLGISSFSLLAGSLNAATIAKSAGSIDAQTMGVFTQLFPFFVVCIFLVIGIMLSFQISAMGAGTVMKSTKALGKWAGKTGAGAVRGIPAVGRAEERIRKRLETTPGINRLIGGPGAYEKEKKVAIGAAAKRMDLIPDTPDGNKALTQRTKMVATTQQQRYDRAAAIELLAKRKALDLTPAQLKQALPEAQRYGADVNAILKARPDYARHLTKIDPVTNKPVPMTIKDAMDKITPGDFVKNVQKDAFKNRTVAYLTAKDVGKNGKFEQLGHKASKSTKKEFKAALTKLYTDSKTPTAVKKSIEASYKKLSTDPNWQI